MVDYASGAIDFACVAAHAFVNPCQDGEWYAENVKRCEKSVRQRQTRASKRFVAARAYDDPLLTVLHTTAAMESAIKFYVFHQRHLGKSAYIEKGTAPAEYAVIAASNSQQNACVMSKAVRESINQAARQANSEVTANDIRIVHDVRDLIQTFQWQSGIDMDKPNDLPARGERAGIHLPGTTGLALDKPITKSGSEPICAIGASAVRDNDLRSGRSLVKMLKKWPYQQRLIKDRNDDRDLNSNAFRRIA